MMRISLVALPLQLLAVLSLASNSIHVSASTSVPLPTDEHGDYNGMDLIEWIRSHEEGIIHPSVRIGRERPGDPTSINGLFVSSAPDAKPIEKGDIIAQIPWDQMIHPGKKYGKYKFFSCAAIYNIAKELNLGEESKLAPYVRYLLSQPRGSMPGEWTEAGKDFLAKQVLGNGELPPYEDTWRNHYQEEWVEKCDGNVYDEVEQRAFWLSASRDEDTLMVPIYDMANHSNDPEKLNTLSHKPHSAGKPFQYVARRKIMPGEQIYNSYNRCNQCSTKEDMETCDTFSFYRTPDVFTHFGFVEDYPQSWAFDPAHDDSSDDSSDDDETEFEFCMHKDAKDGEVDAYWDEDEMPDDDDTVWLKKQLARLQKLDKKKDELEKKLVQVDGEEAESNNKMTRWEWESIWRYHKSLSIAIVAAIRSAESEEEETSDEL